MLFVLVSS
jgi:hypothetical protein